MKVGDRDLDFEAVFAGLHARRSHMELALASCLRLIESDLDQYGWDVPPRLLVCYRDLETADVPGDGVLVGAVFRFSEITTLYGSGDDVAAGIEAAATAVSRFPDQIQENLFAWALVHEGYAAFGTDLDEHAAAVEAAEAGRLRRHPAAQEIRNVLAIDRSGTAMQVTRLRDTGDLLLCTEEDGTRIGGQIGDALRHLMDVTLGHHHARSPEERS